MSEIQGLQSSQNLIDSEYVGPDHGTAHVQFDVTNVVENQSVGRHRFVSNIPFNALIKKVYGYCREPFFTDAIGGVTATLRITTDLGDILAATGFGDAPLDDYGFTEFTGEVITGARQNGTPGEMMNIDFYVGTNPAHIGCMEVFIDWVQMDDYTAHS